MKDLREALIIFPHQLFEGNATLVHGLSHAYLVEHPLFFKEFAFLKQKLVLHRATLRMHADHLRAGGLSVDYVDSDTFISTEALFHRITDEGVTRLHYLDVTDDWLDREIQHASKVTQLALARHETPMFLSELAELKAQFAGGARPRMANFYIAQRIKRQILVERNLPIGGRWSFDVANRKRLPRGLQPPIMRKPDPNPYLKEAQAWIDQHFPNSPGQSAPFEYPVTYGDARSRLRDFCYERLRHFGDYEDAISARHAVLFHSVLTPALNIGLLTPRDVLEAALEMSDEVSINNLEGFVRQVLGWREYVRGAYEFLGRAQRTRNFWSHTRSIPRSFWDGSTGIAPIDAVIRRVLITGYAHHIERLMVLSSFMLLCEFNPDEIYRWFMELFIDAYDWVMVPNVYGMAVYADGGMITTKPYLCSSNYILKMSDFPRGPWCATWDGLYWRFIDKHREMFDSNPRTQMMVRALDRQSDARREAHVRSAELFLDSFQ